MGVFLSYFLCSRRALGYGERCKYVLKLLHVLAFVCLFYCVQHGFVANVFLNALLDTMDTYKEITPYPGVRLYSILDFTKSVRYIEVPANVSSCFCEYTVYACMHALVAT